MRRVNPDTLQIEEVPKKKQVYILFEEIVCDYEHGYNMDVFKDFKTALANYKVRVEEAKEKMEKWTERSRCHRR